MSSLAVCNPSPIMGGLCVVVFMAHGTFLHWVHFHNTPFPANTERVWTPRLSPFRFFLAFSSALSPPTCLCASNSSTLHICSLLLMGLYLFVLSVHTFYWACAYCSVVSGLPQPTSFCLSHSHSMGCTQAGLCPLEWVSGHADFSRCWKWVKIIWHRCRNSWKPNLMACQQPLYACEWSMVHGPI